jgi:hypothetical protein
MNQHLVTVKSYFYTALNAAIKHKRMYRLVFLMAFALVCTTTISAQYGKNDTLIVGAVVYNGDTIPASTLPLVLVTHVLTEAEKARLVEWTRLRNAVYVTYPYALKAGRIVNEINQVTAGMTREDRKKYIKTREVELRREFSTPLKNLSVYQGKVLMKLINRETGNSCYEIIKEIKGGFTAGVYQTVLFFFNTSLKQPYDASGADRAIEIIVYDVRKMYGLT